MSADRNILSAGVITVVSTTAAFVLPDSYGGKGGLPSIRVLIGTGITFAGLSMLADHAPAVAVPLAIGVAGTAFVFYGSPLLANWLMEPGGKKQKVGPTQPQGMQTP